MNETTFENAQVGDKVWDYVKGEGIVKSTTWSESYPLAVTFSEGGQYVFNFDGYNTRHSNRTLFWSPVEIVAPPRPKRKVKKTLERWVNVYADGIIGSEHHSHEAAEALKNPALNIIACVKLTGDYEVEE